MERTNAIHTINRKPGEGVWNIIRFNWHFFLLGVLFLATTLAVSFLLDSPYSTWLFWLGVAGVTGMLVSLLVSWYVYDISGLYHMKWLQFIPGKTPEHIVNIHAGFDETSHLLQQKYPGAQLDVYDFYDPVKHTEPSIRRARKSRAPYPGTRSLSTAEPVQMSGRANWICLFFAAHEIRNDEERAAFFKQLSFHLADEGKIIVVEHIRDLPNLLAWHVGVFHFHRMKTWKQTFREANLSLVLKKQINPFVSLLILGKNGTSS